MKTLALAFISFYKFYISPFLKNVYGGGCRFSPTCSEYAQQSIKKYGFTKGLFMSTLRVIRCNPLSKPSFDPVK